MQNNSRFRRPVLLLLAAVLPAGVRAQINLAPPVLFPCGEAVGVVSADFDGDGDLDMAVNDDVSVAVLPNLGNGTFGPRVIHPAGNVPVIALAVADLDGDGDADLAAANASQTGASYAEVAVLINAGGGGFALPVLVPLPPATNSPTDIQAADLTGDGRPDLAVASYYNNVVHIVVNTPAGGFILGQALTTTNPRAVCLADLDGDGDRDLAAAMTNVFAGVRIFRNSGTGLFTFFSAAGFTAAGGEGPYDLVCSDLDGDGDRDLAGTRYSPSPTVPASGGSLLVYLNSGNATFSPPISYPAGGYLFRLAAADIDLDGPADILVVQSVPSRLFAFRNLGNATFSTAGSFGAPAFVQDVLAADLDGDGDPDAATVRYDLGVYENLRPVGPVAPYAGSGEDFHLLTGVNGAPTTGPGLTVKIARAQDALDLRLTTPQGTFAGAPFVVAAQLFPTGSPPGSPPGLPTIHLGFPGAVILLDGTAGPFPLGLPSSGFLLPLVVPPGLAGQSALFQSAAFSTAAANGFFAATDGHEIRIVP